MTLPRITLLATLLLATPALAQLQITPPATVPAPDKQKPKEPAKETTREKPKVAPHTITKKKEATPAPKPSASPSPTLPATVIPAPAPDNPNVDLVFGAYQRGQYKTAFDLASARAKTGDAKAMTMLGELYSNAMGIRRDYAKAVEWYKRASDAGDREAMFALARLRIAGRGGVHKGEHGRGAVDDGAEDGGDGLHAGAHEALQLVLVARAVLREDGARGGEAAEAGVQRERRLAAQRRRVRGGFQQRKVADAQLGLVLQQAQ